MKFSSLQQDLLPPLQAVSRSVGVRSTLPVLDNILLAIEGNKLKIAATNLEIGVIKYIPVEVEAAGEITVPAKIMVELISSLGQSKIELDSQGDILSINSGKFKAQINGVPASEFPAIPLSEGKGISFPKEIFLSCGQILYAAAVDEGRPVLTGILTETKDGKLDFVATDGFRLAHCQVGLSKEHAQFKSLIPRKTFEEVLRVLSEEEVSDVNISTSQNQNQIIFSVGPTLISSRLIEGTFPSWQKIIPEKLITRALIDKEEFLKAIKLAAIFAKNEANILVLNTKKGRLVLTSQAKELGSQENEVEGEVEGEDLQIAFNAKFLLDAVLAVPSSQLSMEFSGPLSACLIKPIGVDGLEHIIMPVRLS